MADDSDAQTEIGAEIFDQQIGEAEHEAAKSKLSVGNAGGRW